MDKLEAGKGGGISFWSVEQIQQGKQTGNEGGEEGSAAEDTYENG